MVASVRHFGYSRSSCLAPGRVYFDDVLFSDSIVSPSTLENSVFKKHRFQIAPLWRAFSKSSNFADRFRRCSVDDSRIPSKTAPFSFENGLVLTGPKCETIHMKICSAHRFIFIQINSFPYEKFRTKTRFETEALRADGRVRLRIPRGYSRYLLSGYKTAKLNRFLNSNRRTDRQDGSSDTTTHRPFFLPSASALGLGTTLLSDACLCHVAPHAAGFGHVSHVDDPFHDGAPHPMVLLCREGNLDTGPLAVESCRGSLDHLSAMK